MKKLVVLVVALVSVALLGSVVAGEKAETVTLEGKVICAMCTLKEKDWEECQNAVQVKKGDEMVTVYIVKNDVAEEFGHVCTGAKMATVTGTLSEKDGRKWITATEMKVVEEG